MLCVSYRRASSGHRSPQLSDNCVLKSSTLTLRALDTLTGNGFFGQTSPVAFKKVAQNTRREAIAPRRFAIVSTRYPYSLTVRRLLKISINYTFYTRQATHFHVLNLSVCLCIPCASPYMSAVAMPLSRDSFNQCTDCFYRVRLNEVFLPTLTPDQHSV